MSPEPAIAVMLSCYRFLRLFGWFAVDEVGLELWFRSWHQTSLQAWIFALLCCYFPAGGSAPQRQSCKWFVFQVMVARHFISREGNERVTYLFF